MPSEVERAVVELIAKSKGVEPAQIPPDAVLSDLGITSLDTVTLLFDLEERFDIQVPNDRLDAIKRVADVVRGVEELVAAKA
jgi:acyl carrier protein